MIVLKDRRTGVLVRLRRPCPTCGGPIPTGKTVGRPLEYCSARCRSKRKKPCAGCGEVFWMKKESSLCPVCALRAATASGGRKWDQWNECHHCGGWFNPVHSSDRFCTLTCRVRSEMANKRGRLGEACGGGSELEFTRSSPAYVTRIMLAERDGWVCGVCRGEIDPSIPFPDPLSASVDHKQPLSKGGRHTMENTQLAHLRCNSSKGSKCRPVACQGDS